MTTLADFHGSASLRAALLDALADGADAPMLLVNAEPVPDAEVVVARCRAFAESLRGNSGAVIVTVLHQAPPGLDHWAAHQASAMLWAFTRAAALDWAPRRIRLNVVGLGITPDDFSGPREQAGRTGAAAPAIAATDADLAETVLAIARMGSMTGQLIRLGA